ncbi:hypothetical protein NQ317_019826 [Molorchus minor]|uniref:EB domain-containing protein n=1 Tax=Molorchus minor TaxID=1323400 RepID=A0ABQ9J346_9CUCU|nr:hypothetical protein NQ317_019826 [Molorchus minor]
MHKEQENCTTSAELSENAEPLVTFVQETELANVFTQPICPINMEINVLEIRTEVSCKNRLNSAKLSFGETSLVDQKCQYDEHCVEGAFCESQSRCKCKDYYYLMKMEHVQQLNGVQLNPELNLDICTKFKWGRTRWVPYFTTSAVVLFATLFIMYLFDFCLRISMINN